MQAVHHLSIDIETYSDVDISKAGLYKYVQSPAFSILLFAYSLDGAPVQVIDLVGGGIQSGFPLWLVNAIKDTNVVKHAYNAVFEWYCLCRHFNWNPEREGWHMLSAWRDTMLHSLYCGYPASLGAAGRALGLPEDKQKLAAGKALIRYFCAPCKPTKTNGMRIRNLPHHDPEKWRLFQEYNAQDVMAEMEIERRLSNFPVPESVQAQWITDQRINLRGVAVDLDLVNNAIWCGETMHERYTKEAVQVSGLENPSSVAQLTRWLEKETGESVSNLRKDTVSGLLTKGLPSEAATRMLEIRQELGKTSTRKYNAMETCVCTDGRVRGLLQFYGANRTGRWAGRLVQVQNLPRTHLELLPFARQLVKERAVNALRVVYGSVPDTLSQLIRTAFIATPGKVFVDADFSAIEARVVAWLSGENWVLDVFQTHGKIYEATASQMFGIPMEHIVKGRPEYAYRQRGKVATLALGYQGGPGALIQMGALQNGLTEEELPDIVEKWRKANAHTVNFWYTIQAAAEVAVQQGKRTNVGCVTVAREYDPQAGLDFLTILLPSGRKLYYANPHMGTNRFGRPSLCYYGMNQVSRKWEVTETYGGKLVENITQAVARDCLADAIERLEAAGFPVVFHIHDEVVIELPERNGILDEVVAVMAQPVPWAPGLPMAADGWVDTFFKKE